MYIPYSSICPMFVIMFNFSLQTVKFRGVKQLVNDQNNTVVIKICVAKAVKQNICMVHRTV